MQFFIPFVRSENSWEFKTNLNCSSLIKEFENSLRKRRADNRQRTTKHNTKKETNADVPVQRNLRVSIFISLASRQVISKIKDKFIFVSVPLNSYLLQLGVIIVLSLMKNY